MHGIYVDLSNRSMQQLTSVCSIHKIRFCVEVRFAMRDGRWKLYTGTFVKRKIKYNSFVIRFELRLSVKRRKKRLVLSG